ncbi:MAG: class I SAM-dependent methyltransferase [Woeseiaceae bacterium]
MGRLKARKTKIWHQNFLIYRYLWPNIEWAVTSVKSQLGILKPTVLDVGCGEKPYKDLFEDCEYIGLNHSDENADPDILGDATDLPVDTESIDIVFTTQVIEHVPEPQKMMNECFRVLKPGGALILSAPFYWPIHEEPYDFYRYTQYGLEYMLKTAGFKSWEIKSDGGDWAQILLSINLKVSKVLFPLRILINCLGLLAEKISTSEKSPANYTLKAFK